VVDKTGRGMAKVKCNHCEHIFHGGCSRIRGHLLGDTKSGVAACTGAPEDVFARMTELQRRSTAKKTYTPLFPVSASTSAGTAVSASQSSLSVSTGMAGLKQVSLPHSWSGAELDRTHAAVARLFYGTGIPFNVARSPFFLDAVMAVAAYGKASGGQYRPPSYDLLGTSLLDNEVNRVKQEAAIMRTDLKHFGYTLTSDGWTSVQNRPLLNILMVTHKGSEFISAVDTSGEIKSGQYIFSQVKAALQKIGAQHCVQVTMDNAANCTSAGRLLESEFPHVTFTGCVAHSLDLALESIGKLEWVADYVTAGRNLTLFITRHQAPQAIFRTKSTKQLVKPADTRFGTQFMMLLRLYDLRKALQQTFVDPAWTAYIEDHPQHEDFHTQMFANVMNAAWWTRMDAILSVLKPIFVLLRLVDGNSPCTGKVYYHVFDCIEKSQTLIVLQLMRVRC
jgi:Protein of unknown function (DUF 659)